MFEEHDVPHDEIDEAWARMAVVERLIADAANYRDRIRRDPFVHPGEKPRRVIALAKRLARELIPILKQQKAVDIITGTPRGEIVETAWGAD